MKYLCLLAVILTEAPAVDAQRSHIGLFAGAAAYTGDITSNVFPRKVTNGAIGVTYNYELSSLLTLRSGFTYSIVGGADRYSTKPTLTNRNLSFETRIFELSAIGEYYLQNLSYSPSSPYVFAGLAVFSFNPYAYDPEGQKIFLRPLSTEGQGLSAYPNRKPYSLTQLAIPFGGGYKFVLSDNLRVGIEFGLRKLFTEYLDDVSTNYIDKADLLAAKGQIAVDMAYRGDEVIGGSLSYPSKGEKRGDPKSKDYYYFAGAHVTYKLTPPHKSNTSCPVNVY